MKLISFPPLIAMSENNKSAVLLVSSMRSINVLIKKSFKNISLLRIFYTSFICSSFTFSSLRKFYFQPKQSKKNNFLAKQNINFNRHFYYTCKCHKRLLWKDNHCCWLDGWMAGDPTFLLRTPSTYLAICE